MERRKGVRLVFLCEDDEHWRFARFTFLRLGYHDRELRVLLAPGGRGAAEQWVRVQYATEVRAQRRKITSQNVALAVVIDADRQTVDRRHEQLAAGLSAAALERRSSDEQIVLWVPKRHIETWIADLVGKPANEDDEYKNAMRGADYRRAASCFVDRYRDRPPNPPAVNVARIRGNRSTTELTSLPSPLVRSLLLLGHRENGLGHEHERRPPTPSCICSHGASIAAIAAGGCV